MRYPLWYFSWIKGRNMKVINKNQHVTPGQIFISNPQFGFLLTLPGVLIVFSIIIFPFVYLIYTSLWYNIIMGVKTFAGLGNYSKTLRDENFWNFLGHTLIYTVGTVGLSFLIGLTIALLLNKVKILPALFRPAVILPWAIPPVIAALNWRILLRTEGVVNGLAMGIGMIGSPIKWLSTELLAMISVIICDVWVNTPFVAVLLLAGLQTIPQVMYDAAKVDGASFYQSFLYITLPFLKPTILIVLTIRTMFAFRAFDIIFALTEGGPGDATEVLGTWIYKKAFWEFDLGFASAISVILLIITVGCVAMYFKFLGGSIETS